MQRKLAAGRLRPRFLPGWRFFSFCLVLLLSLWQGVVLAAFAPPAPPPELDETLTDFQTRQQLEAERFLQSGQGGELLELPGPAAAGDEAAGVVRLTFDYTGDLTLFVPRHGRTYLKIIDGAGMPLEIQSFRQNGQAFIPELTASLSELMLRQYQGASSAQLVLKVKESPEPLLFRLHSKAAANARRAVTTFIYTIRVRKLNALESFALEPYPFVQLSGSDQVLDVNADFDSLQQVLLKGMAAARQRSEQAAAARVVSRQVGR